MKHGGRGQWLGPPARNEAPHGPATVQRVAWGQADAQRGAATGGHPGLTSASAFRSCVRRPPSSFTTFLAPSATAASMRSRCLSSSASSSGPGRRGQPSGPCPALPGPAPLPQASPGSGDPLASRLLIFIRSRATFSWLSRSICWAAARSFLSYGGMTYAPTEQGPALSLPGQTKAEAKPPWLASVWGSASSIR